MDELQVMAKVLECLEALDDNDARSRVVRWLIEKLKLQVEGAQQIPMREHVSDLNKGGVERSDQASQLNPAATIWVKQNGIVHSDLEAIFHLANSEADIIAAHIPGKNNRERVINCYLLVGAKELLKTGEPTFSDASARNLCETFGCLDTTNHSKYINSKGNELVGSKEKGWTLTNPGKKKCAMLIKDIASINQ